MSDISSTHNDFQIPINNSQQQIIQSSFVGQPTIENGLGPDHIINELFFPMDLDAKPTEYNTGKVNTIVMLESS